MKNYINDMANNTGNNKMTNTMKKTLLVLILTGASVILGIIGSATLFHALNFNFNIEIFHFYINSVTAKITYVLMFLIFVISCVAFFSVGKTTHIESNNKQIPFLSTFISTLAACVCVLSAANMLMEGAPDIRPVIFFIKVILTLLSSIFFIIEALGLTEKKITLGALSLIPATMFAFTILSSYFDPTVAMNSAAKTLEIIMLVAFMLYFKDKAGVSLDRPGTQKKLIFSGVLALGTGGAVALARFATVFMYSSDIEISLSEAGLSLVLWIYIFIHFVQSIISLKETSANSENTPEISENSSLNAEALAEDPEEDFETLEGFADTESIEDIQQLDGFEELDDIDEFETIEPLEENEDLTEEVLEIEDITPPEAADDVVLDIDDFDEERKSASKSTSPLSSLKFDFDDVDFSEELPTEIKETKAEPASPKDETPAEAALIMEFMANEESLKEAPAQKASVSKTRRKITSAKKAPESQTHTKATDSSPSEKEPERVASTEKAKALSDSEEFSINSAPKNTKRDNNFSIGDGE